MTTQVMYSSLDKKGSFPLSFEQERMWFLLQVKPENYAYHIRVAIEIIGPLKVNILEQSINEIVRRHEILRTTFNIIDGQPRQIISSPFRVELPVINLQKLTVTEREHEAKRLTTQIFLSPFNLNTGPLWRVSLLQMESARHIMVLSMHNIVCDGDRSIGIFFREITALYEAFSSGEASSLVELPIQYKEFALRQRQQLQEEILKTQLSYWKQQLGDHLPRLQLPIDHPRRPAIGTYSGAYQDLKLKGDLCDQLKRLSQQQGVTLFVTLLAAFKTLLYRYTKLEDILVGSPVSGRNLSVTEELIGDFGNYLALRTDMSGNPSFLQLLSRVARVKSQADNHQDYPFQKLVEELKLEPDSSFPNLFQVLFILRSDFLPTLLLPNLTLTPVDIESTFLPLDLCISINDTHQGLVWRWEYNTDLFEGATISRIIKHFQNLLESIVANPEGHIGELPLLTQVERHQLLVEWNNTKTEYASSLIHKLVEAQVAQNSNAVAVVTENQQLTYKELNCRANQLANYLQKLGIKPEGLVGICVERSLLQMVAILGVLKAGGAYVPLDPAYPQERLAYMLTDANVQVLLTTETLLKASSKIAEIAKNQEIVCLDSEREKISLESDENLVSLLTPDNLAYLIYTSGSTGKPKGVMMEHLALANLIDWHLHNRKVGANTLQFAPLSFDISFHEIFSTWCSGGTLVLIAEEVRLLPEALLNAIAQNKISKLYLPFVALQQLAEVINEQTVPTTLREVMTAGEQLQITPAIANFFRQTGCTLHNHYGATECQDVTTFTLTGDANSWQTLPPIGRPINNTQVYILDEFYQPVPIGVAGELYIGGCGLARGYFNPSGSQSLQRGEPPQRAAHRPDLTQERFIPNPLGSGRLYKTGDLARYRTDGNIEHLGRADRQVKIRGFRIELGEIEGLLAKHPTVRESVVIARSDVPGSKRLIAYVVPVEFEVAPQRSLALRSYLKEHLPDYMVPNSIVMLDKMPLTPSGKVDRRALPEPDLSRPEWAGALVMPQSDTEKLIARVWQELLQLEEVGIYDNFFELGGNSLLLIQVHKKLIEILGVDLPMVVLFQHPILHGLAQHLQQTQIEKSTVKLLHQGNNLPLVRVSRIQNLPLSFTQEQMWFLSELEPTNPFYNEIEALRLLGSVNVVALQQSLNKIIQRHEALRTNFKTVDGQLFQAIALNLTLTVPIVDLEYLPEDDREIAAQQLATAQAQQPFDLASDPLIQVTLFKLREAEYVLLLKIHHIVWDGWSMDVFVHELAAFYLAECNNLSLELPQLPIQYADFADWQRSWCSREVIESQLAYWKQQLEGAPALLELPTDRVRPSTQTFRGARQRVALSCQLTEALSSLSQRLGVTLFMTLLAAFQILLSRYTGQTDICVGTVHANRDRPEVRGLIGFFVNTLVLRTDLSGNPSFEDALSRSRDVALGAYAHVDLPFEKLVEELQPERDLSRHPIFQVWFNLLPKGDIPLELSGLDVEPIFMEEAASKFDLTLYVAEQKQAIQLKLVYNTDLFNADTMQRMLLHYQTLLEGVVANPEERISTLPLLTETDRYYLKSRGNVVSPTNRFITFGKQDIEQSIPSRFEQQVRKYPQNIAVHTKNYHWTYSELNCRANRVAQAILFQCTSSEEKIALLFEHDAPMIAGILGVLKVGKTYVPLDPNYPSDRVVYILEDSLASAVITNNKNLVRAQELTRGTIPLINIDDISFPGCDDEIVREISPDTVAYILYTSGSTGQPKGVIQNHRNVLHFIRNYTNNLHINEQDGLTMLSSYSFDAAIMDIFAAILNGATLYPINIKESGLTDLSQWLQQHHITIYHSTPTLYRHFVSTLSGDEKLTQIRLVVLGGESVVKTDVDLYKEYFSNECIFVNGLGPTESTVTLQYFINKQTEITRNTVPVGYSVEETEILLLNEAGEKTDIYGEIAIRSPYIALGYWRKPDLTQLVFKSDRASDSRRIYRTGDLGRLRPDGSIEFLGRKDFQVKIRGFRIELGEIEAALTQHPSVRENVVIAREDVPGNKHLVAYVVPTQTLTTDELRHFLKQKLPDYIVPSAFVMLEALPLTPSGKVDRLTLPVPDNSSSLDNFVPPRDKLELQLTQIWSEVLKVDKVGVRNNFFDLGGHSLLAVRLMAKIQQQFGKNLPLAALFQSPTVEELANILQRDSDSSYWSPLVAIQPNGSKRPFFCVPGIGANVIYFYDLARHLGTDQPFYGLQALGLDGDSPPHTSIEEMAAYYIEAIQTQEPQGPYLLGGHSFGGIVAFEMATQLHKQGHEVALLAIIDVVAPILSKKSIGVDLDDADCLTNFASFI